MSPGRAIRWSWPGSWTSTRRGACPGSEQLMDFGGEVALAVAGRRVRLFPGARQSRSLLSYGSAEFLELFLQKGPDGVGLGKVRQNAQDVVKVLQGPTHKPRRYPHIRYGGLIQAPCLIGLPSG